MELAQVEGNLRKKVKDIFLNTVPRYHAHTLKVVTNMKRMMKEIDDPQDKTILLSWLHIFTTWAIQCLIGAIMWVISIIKLLKSDLILRQGLNLAKRYLGPWKKTWTWSDVFGKKRTVFAQVSAWLLNLWRKIQESFLEVLARTTVKDLLGGAKQDPRKEVVPSLRRWPDESKA